METDNFETYALFALEKIEKAVQDVPPFDIPAKWFRLHRNWSRMLADYRERKAVNA